MVKCLKKFFKMWNLVVSKAENDNLTPKTAKNFIFSFSRMNKKDHSFLEPTNDQIDIKTEAKFNKPLFI